MGNAAPWRRLAPQQRLLLLLLMLPVIEAAGGGTAWYSHDYEYNYLQAIIVIVLICMSIAFEHVWHIIEHGAEHGYRYETYNIEQPHASAWTGVRSSSPPPGVHRKGLADHPSRLGRDGGPATTPQAPASALRRVGSSIGESLVGIWPGGPLGKYSLTPHKAKHVRLRWELANRAGKEFMVLGFLAFSIFLCNQAGIFGLLPQGYAGKDKEWHLPADDVDWLHMAEVVHVKLFLAALAYFVIMSRVVYKSEQQIHKWEVLRLRRSKHLRMASAISRTLRIYEEATLDEELKKFCLYRDYFVESVCLWTETRPILWDELQKKLFTEYLDRTFWSLAQQRSCFHRQLDEGFDGNGIAFSAYLALTVERGVRDTIEIHTPTWCAVLLMFSVFAIIHRALHWNLVHLAPVFVVVAWLLLAAMWLVIRWRRQFITRTVQACQAEGAELSASDVPDKGGPLHHRMDTQLIPLRALQVAVFLICFVFATTVADKHKWEVDSQRAGIDLCLFLLLFAATWYILPIMIPDFLAMMSLPPYVDGVNLQHLYAIIDKQLETGGTIVEAARERAKTPDESPDGVGIRLRNNAKEDGVQRIEGFFERQQADIKRLEARVLELEEWKFSKTDGRGGTSQSTRKNPSSGTAGFGGLEPQLPGAIATITTVRLEGGKSGTEKDEEATLTLNAAFHTTR